MVNVNFTDVCFMADSYIDASLARIYVSQQHQKEQVRPRIFLAHDHEWPERADAIVRRYDAVVSDDADKFVDMLLLLRSSFFIGNPASSLTTNVARVRRAVANTPNLAGWRATFPPRSAHMTIV